MQDLTATRELMRQSGIDAWLVYDFRGSNPVLWQLLGETRATTRRSFLLIYADREPILITHAIETQQFASDTVDLVTYVDRRQMQQQLTDAVVGSARVAAEYSPNGALPTLSWVDAGTLEFVRECTRMGDRVAEIVSSADLVQVALATWTADGLESHRSACRHVDAIKESAFAFVAEHLQSGTVSEYAVQQFIMQQFEQLGLETDHRPIVGVNAHSSDPHYDPGPEDSAQIGPGHWLLIDLWARYPGAANVFGDITWVATSAATVTPLQTRVFDAVRKARDQVVERLEEGWKRGEELQGWQLDQVAKEVLTAAGYADFILHRTGHSLGPGPRVHALGVNLDNLETHDTRRILPGLGFSVEPGLYLPDFGVRLEINVFMDPDRGPTVTTPAQDRVVRLV
jgi:Xaa-Pro dipeptidase